MIESNNNEERAIRVEQMVDSLHRESAHHLFVEEQRLAQSARVPSDRANTMLQQSLERLASLPAR
jgi:hypothetical protein